MIPVGIKAIKRSEVYVVEFQEIARTAAPAAGVEDLRVASEAIYQLVPPVPGIGE